MSRNEPTFDALGARLLDGALGDARGDAVGDDDDLGVLEVLRLARTILSELRTILFQSRICIFSCSGTVIFG